jgi:hypothetical protein
MRVILERGKQKELVNKAKGERTWKQLSKILKVAPSYLSELSVEKGLLSEDAYKKICSLINENYDSFILKKLEDNWGKSKGGLCSPKNTKSFIFPQESEELAEFFGIMLGDGNVTRYEKGKRIRCYVISVAGELNSEEDYLCNYISPLMERLFREKPKFRKTAYGEILLRLHGLNLIKFLNEKGLKSGNKKANNQTIPEWISKDDNYLRACIRGLIDTDGSVHYIAETNRNIRISFVSHIPALLNDVRQALLKLGLLPSKIISNREIYLTSKQTVDEYIRTIGFNNSKHLKRIKILKNLKLINQKY